MTNLGHCQNFVPLLVTLKSGVDPRVTRSNDKMRMGLAKWPVGLELETFRFMNLSGNVLTHKDTLPMVFSVLLEVSDL